MSLQFDPVTHTYRLGDHTFKYSVSDLVNKYVKPFPAKLIAEKTAKRDGVEASEVLRKWDLNKEIACQYGNAIDLAVQYWVDFGEMPKQDFLREIVERFAKDYPGDLVAQVSMYDIDKSVCGTADVLQKLGNRHVNLIDVKSNAEFYKKPKGKLLEPFNDLQDSNLNKYRIQLSLYRDLLKKHDIIVDNMLVWHPFEGIIKIEPVNTQEIWQKI